jgi:hypothetical protein
MRKVLFLILFFLCGSWCFAGDTYLKDLKNEGIKVIEKQSFEVSFENWGKVRFVSGVKTDWPNKLKLFLSNAQQKIIYRFPEFSGNIWVFNEVRTVSFKDVNKDKLKDIIIIADNVTGIGKEGTIPFPVCGIYFQEGKSLKTYRSWIRRSMKQGKTKPLTRCINIPRKTLAA